MKKLRWLGWFGLYCPFGEDGLKLTCLARVVEVEFKKCRKPIFKDAKNAMLSAMRHSVECRLWMDGKKAFVIGVPLEENFEWC